MNIRFIGDVHGHFGPYLKKAREASHSLQVGDLGFEYSPLASLDSEAHKVILGNHDNLPITKDVPHILGDFGLVFEKIFYVRGAASIDKHNRTIGVDWWDEEELSYAQCQAAIDLYREIKPDYVASHDCPSFISHEIHGENKYGISKTQRMLDIFIQIHRPKLWIFGHHHRDWTQQIGPTKFKCLHILSHFDVSLT